MPDKPTISIKVRQIISDQFGLNQDDLNPETTLGSLDADSLDQVEICMAIEEVFKIEIPDEDAETILVSSSTIGQIEEYVTNNAD